jgi:very-short-patch-repair endonuclease/predicted transcriptional regulator of viral defense system
MDPEAVRESSRGQRIWALATEQHGVVSRQQLVALRVHPDAIKHRIARGRLHRLRRGVYAVGSPQVSREGHWMAALLCCGAHSVLSHRTAAELWGLQIGQRSERQPVDVCVPGEQRYRRAGIRIHRSVRLPAADLTHRNRLPVTSPIRTLIDLASELPASTLERAVNEADRLDLVDPDTLRAHLAERAHVRGVAALRRLLDRRTFVLTDSALERRFLPLVRRAGLPRPETAVHLNGFKVDFHWPGLGLVVETDGLRYHRTPTQQARDRERDHAHARAGLTSLRFTHAQVRHEPEGVVATLRAVARRLSGAA